MERKDCYIFFKEEKAGGALLDARFKDAIAEHGDLRKVGGAEIYYLSFGSKKERDNAFELLAFASRLLGFPEGFVFKGEDVLK